MKKKEILGEEYEREEKRRGGEGLGIKLGGLGDDNGRGL